METKTFAANEARKINAHQLIADFGGHYFNPLIGESASETCTNTEHVISFLYDMFDRDLVSDDMRPGITMIIQTVWTAMQYERDVAEMERGEA